MILIFLVNTLLFMLLRMYMSDTNVHVGHLRMCPPDTYVCVTRTVTYVSARHLRMCPPDSYVTLPHTLSRGLCLLAKKAPLLSIERLFRVSFRSSQTGRDKKNFHFITYIINTNSRLSLSRGTCAMDNLICHWADN